MKTQIKFLFYFFLFTSFTSFAQLRSDTIHIAHYDIHLSILDFTNKKISGETTLTAVLKKNNINQVLLDLLALQVDSVKVNGDNVLYTHENEQVVIALPSPVNSGDTLLLTIYYHGVPAKDPSWGGFYFSGQYAFNLGVAFTSLPHNYGRVWFPCLDLFTDKSTYTFSIRTAASKMAICGGMLTDTTHLPDNTIIWQWTLNNPIPTYLASVAVGNYQLYEDMYQGANGDIPITIYAPPSYYDRVPGSFSNLKRTLEIFEQYYGPYQWDRVGYVLVNFSSGAMEHAMNIAYPQFAVNGNEMYESLYIHELSHAWFGNQITCNRAEEMWINEGFARYSEAIADGELYPDEDPYSDGYKINIRQLQAEVLRYAHINDNGYHALNNVPQAVTYGSTSYDKGALVVHTLRNYIGNSLFFPALQSLLETYKFQNLDSKTLIDYLSLETGIDLNDFYESWIDQPGFLHFSIDSIRPAGAHHYYVYIRQRLNHAHHFGNNNKIDITLFDQHGRNVTIPFQFSGEYAIAEMEFEGNPVFGVIDLDEKISDAVIDYNRWFTQPSTFISEEAAFVSTISQLDSALWLRVEHHFVAPDPLKTPNPHIIRLSDNHFWRVEYYGGGDVNGILSFKYKADTENSLDKLLFSGGYTSSDLILLYRRDVSQDWQIIASTLQGNLSGMIKSTSLRPGEYTLAIGNRNAVGDISLPQEKEKLEIYPNPAKDGFTVIFPHYENYPYYYLYTIEGKVVKQGKIVESSTEIKLSNLAKGHYILKLYSQNYQESVSQKLILQ